MILIVLAALQAGDAVSAGDFRVEPPTIHCLGFEWDIAGDDDRDAAVAVEYRKAGTAEWRPALPLLRIGDEKVWRAREFLEYWTPRMFAGSILDLEPETDYEVRLSMSDPDGVRGEAVKLVAARTRGEPKPPEGGRVLHVYPPDWTGPRIEPSFNGLKEAYYGPGRGDWSVVRERPVKPGDVILVHAGLYKADRLDYVTPLEIPFDGTYVFTIDGTPGKPIVIKGAGDGEAIFDGAGCHRLFDVAAADHTHFEGLTIRNADVAIHAGQKDVIGSSGLVVRRCRMEDVGIGVITQWAGSKNFHISDNVMVGRDDPHRLVGWQGAGTGKYKPSPLKSYFGVKVYGQGHVICHNAVSFFHDGICVCTHGTPPKDPAERAAAIDIYNNDVHLMVDDFIETDGGVHNIRVFRNRGFNAAHHGYSAQPVFGGPSYFIRNIGYNVAFGGAIKTGGANPAGVLVYHNTFVSENSNARGCSNVHYRNNLFMGTDHAERPLLGHLTYTSYTSSDWNGWRPNASGRPQFLWLSPPAGTLRDYALAGKPLAEYATLDEFRSGTGQEKNGRLVDYGIFENVRPPDPKDPHAVYPSAGVDFRLKPGSAAVDAGCRLPNVNDDATGAAPDLGALELGRPLPVWGPRPVLK
jgi:hypothetical protein